MQRLTYRKRHSYATKSNQTRVVKTPGKNPIFSFLSSALGCTRSLQAFAPFLVALIVLMWKRRWEPCVSVHEQEGERAEMPCDWQEDPRSMLFLALKFHEDPSLGIWAIITFSFNF